jgi:hypothetical protein
MMLHKSVGEIEQLSAKEYAAWQAYFDLVTEGQKDGANKGT